MFYRMQANDIVAILNPLFENDDSDKPILTVPVPATKPDEIKYVIVDFYDWLDCVSGYEGEIHNLDKRFIKSFREEHKEIILMSSLNGTSAKIDERIEPYKDKLQPVLDMYMVFVKYLEKCQIRLFDLYKNNNIRTCPMPLVPFSFALDRLSKSLYKIEEIKVEADHRLAEGPKKEEGWNNRYRVQKISTLDFISRTSLDLGVKLYHTNIGVTDTSLLPEKWKILLNRIKPEQVTYKYRVQLVKKLFSQYLYVGNHKIQYSDGSLEKVFLLNYPLYMINNNAAKFESIKSEEISFDIRNNLEENKNFWNS